MIKQNDRTLLKSKNITEEKVKEQLSQFKIGFPFMDIKAPASTTNGILSLDEEQKLMFTDQFRNGIDNGYTVLKFVPASGAATRMFKDLFAFINADKDKQAQEKKRRPHQRLSNPYSTFCIFKRTGTNLRYGFQQRTSRF